MVTPRSERVTPRPLFRCTIATATGMALGFAPAFGAFGLLALTAGQVNAGQVNAEPVSAEPPTLAERTEMYFRYLEIPSRIRGPALLEPHWLADGDRFWYTAGAPEETVIYLVDPVADTRVELFDTARLRAGLEEALGQPPPHRGLPFDDFSFVGEGEGAVRFTVDGSEYRLDLETYEIQPLGEAPPGGPRVLASDGRWYHDVVGPYFFGRIHGVPSPDGAWLLEAEDHDLWLRSIVDGSRRRLTTDGEADHRWHVIHPGAGDWGGPPPLANWSPDGRFVAAWRSARRGLPRKPVVHWRQPFGHPLHRQHRVHAIPEVDWEPSAPAPVDLYIGELRDEGVRWVKADSGEPSHLVAGVRWRPDGSELWFHREVDWGKRLDLMAADPRTGRSRIVLTETAETFIDWTANARYDLLQFLADGENFLWRSNRDGWYDLYLHDLDGNLVRRLTEGPFEVSWPYAVDEREGWIYYGVFGTGERPYDTYLERARLDGSGSERLTDRNGQPGPYGFSPSKRFFLLHSSTPTEPDVVELRRADGTLLQTLAREDVDWLVEELHWQPPEELVVKAADGKTDLHGVLFKPWDFDPEKKYPVVQHLYGNPSFNFHAFFPWFGGPDRDAGALAQLGFVTFVVEERGTHGRGKAFRDVVYRDVFHPQVADDVATLRQLAAERPYMDLGRVGVTGSSYGGIATIRNMLLAPDTYHVGVAASSRWLKWHARLYGAPYHEIPEVYERSSSLTHVGNLKGRLLLAQATDDDIEEVMVLVEALTDAGKPYDLMILPEGGHSLTERHPRYFHEARIRYLVEHLKPELGVEVGSR
jgi:dipeptidyl aminopeptidase/acylaminoacyl peptidase